MSFLFGFLAFGTLWFYVLVAIAWVIMTIAIENEAVGKATWAFLLTLATLQWVSHVPILQWIVHHPLDLLLSAIAYLIVGTVYSFLKWTLLVYKIRDEVRKNKQDSEYGRYARTKPPDPGDFAGQITGWIMYWPVSGLWTLINDPIKQACQYIYRKCESSYQRIAANAFKEFKPEEPKEL